MLNNALQRMFNLIARSSETVSASRRSRGRKSRHIEALEQRALLAGNPFVQSIVRANAAPATTSGTSAVFEVTFSEPVTGVDSADFQVVTTGSTTVASTVSVSPISTSVYNVTASGIFGAGTVKLNLVDDLSIRDASNLGLVSSSISFQSQQQFASGATPDKVEVADLNGDGFLDVVTPNEGPNRVGVFIGNGDGTFQAQVQYVTGAGPRFVKIADFNADGKPDLAVANRSSSSNTIGILLGNGNGTFQTQVTYAAGSNPEALDIGDINGDGKLDIVVVNLNNNVGVFRGNGNGTFQAMVTTATGTAPRSVALADVDADGDLDVVTGNSTANTVTVLKNNGSGTLTVSGTFGTGATPLAVALRDLNGDNRPDIAVANSGSATVGVLLNTGTGAFGTQTSLAVGTTPSSVATQDINGDGKLDLAVANFGSNTVSVLAGNGSGGFATQQPFGVGAGPNGVALADLNNDGKLDLLSANATASTISSVLNNNGSYTNGQTYTVLGQVVSTSFMASGTLTSGVSSMTVTFNGPLVGIGTASNYQLQAAGSDGLLLTTDSVVSPTSVTVSGSNVTLNFASLLVEDVYRLTVKDTITDSFGIELDGDGNGTAGGDWRRDFVVGALSATLSSTDGSFFDLRFSGSSPGQIVQGSRNAFDGLNQLQIGGIQYSPIETSPPSAVRVEAVTGPSGTDFSVPIGSFGSVPGLSSSITATSSAARFAAEVSLSVYLPSGGAVTYFEVAIFVDGIQGKTRLIEEGPSLGVGAPGWVRVSLDDLLALSVGGHTIDVRARQLGGSPVVIDNTANTNTLAITRFEPIAASQPSAVRVEAVTGPSGTDFSVPIGSFGSVPGLSSSITATSSAARFAAEVSLSVYLPSGGAVTYFEVAIFVDGIQGKTRLIEEGPSLGVGAPGWVRVSLDDLLALSVGGHTIDVRARQLGGSPVVIDNTANTNTLAITRFEPIAAAAFDDGMQTVVTQVAVHSGLTVNREVTVPIAGTQNFARTVEVFTNPTGSTISVPVRVAGNLGSDAATTVFATSDGDTIVEPTDWWFGTDDADGTGTPAVIHLLHGPRGLSPASVNVLEDNVDWTYNLPVAPGETKRLATFTILGNTRAEAIAAVNSLVNVNGFGGEAAAFLTQSELDSLANFQFNQAPTSILVSPAEVAENQPAGTIAGTLTTSDPNPGDTFVYSLVPGDGSSGNSVFMIEADTIKTTESFDFEAQQNYSIRVRSTDQNGLFVEQILTIVVTNVNEAPADVSLTGNSFSENAGANFVIGTLSAVDPDAGETITYSLPSNTANNNQFNINGTSLRASNSFDFETGSTYSITVRATDAGGLSFDKSFTITVTNVNESPTDISLPNTLVAENLPTGTNVGSFQTVDPDSGNTFTYALLTGTGSDHNANFTIVGDTLKTATTFNFEGQSSYSIRVRSTDQNGLYVEKVFTIQITNVTELGGIDTQLGQTQRSYVRYLDVLFDRPDDIMSMVNNGRFQLTRMDLNGLNPSGVALSPGMFSAVGNSARLDFGVNGLGGNRNTTAGDGYYELGVDMDGNGSYESKKYFYRLLGDVNGDRKVDSTDSSLVTSAFGTTNPDRDVNGDGTVNANDRTLVLRSIGRKLKDDLFADD